jgi:hypothetical protein
MVLPGSRRIPRVPRYSGSAQTEPHAFRVRDFHPLRSAFPSRSTIHAVSYSAAGRAADSKQPSNPHAATVHAYHTAQVWALPPSLAATEGIAVALKATLLSLPPGT